jgi:peptidoglycan/xylan/chitin deacetylase (PgdA/CDA1 family)
VPWIYGRYSRVLLKRKAIKSNALVLTFDDGPGNRLTPAILDILADHNAKATFFLLGRNIVGRESIVKQIEERGHEICSHGYDHLNYWKVSPLCALSDIKRGWQAIDKALGKTRRMYPFRPPGGRLNLFCLLYLWIHKTPIFYWTLVSGDTWPVGKRDSQRAALLAGKTGGAVVLAHDFDRTTNDIDKMALDSISLSLVTAQETGMKVMVLSELLDRSWEI